MWGHTRDVEFEAGTFFFFLSTICLFFICVYRSHILKTIVLLNSIFFLISLILDGTVLMSHDLIIYTYLNQ